jgi:hypothetical protein
VSVWQQKISQIGIQLFGLIGLKCQKNLMTINLLIDPDLVFLRKLQPLLNHQIGSRLVLTGPRRPDEFVKKSPKE